MTVTERLRWRDVRRTAAFRLTLRLGLAFVAGTVALLALIYAAVGNELAQRSDAILRDEMQRMQRLPADRLPQSIAAELRLHPRGLVYLALVSGTGERVAGNIDPPAGWQSGRPMTLDPGPAGAPVRLLVARTRAGELLVVGRDDTPISDLRRDLLLILLSSGVVILALTGTVGVLVSLAPLRRVARLQAASSAIAAGDHDTRMPVSGSGDEFDRVAETVNTMVDEMTRVMTQVKGATDAIAHDLRTPLARLRAQLVSAADASREPATGEALVAAIADLDLTLARFAALLRASELDTSGRQASFRQIAVADLLVAVAELYEPLAEERGVTLTVEAGSDRTIMADMELMIEAVGNLVDNAIRFARHRVSLTSDAEGIAVSDDGPGLEPGQQALLSERIARGRVARDGGGGLGLGIVAAIVRLHHFTLGLHDARPGLRAVITLGPP